MKSLFLLGVGIALGMGTASMLPPVHQNHFAGSIPTVEQNNDGAFRDGFFLGRLTAEAGAAPYIAIGRWSTAQDRASFTAGYRQGYSEVLANRAGS
jgi:hypothetical protein